MRVFERPGPVNTDEVIEIVKAVSSNLFHPSKGARFIELLAKPGFSLVPDVNIEYLR
jgi:hypothetical protein